MLRFLIPSNKFSIFKIGQSYILVSDEYLTSYSRNRNLPEADQPVEAAPSLPDPTLVVPPSYTTSTTASPAYTQEEAAAYPPPPYPGLDRTRYSDTSTETETE